MESLHLSFQRVVMDFDLFKGINLSPLVNLSHMFYADDAVFVGQWCDDNINTLVHVLECFFRASGLRINMCKSKIMGVNVGDDKIKAAALKLGCRILNTPFTYLGTKVGGNMSRVQAWTEIVDKVKSRLSKWKIKSLSIRGIETELPGPQKSKIPTVRTFLSMPGKLQFRNRDDLTVAISCDRRKTLQLDLSDILL
ncbi:hypothetical protein Tco_0945554 [Tanacetum coccineum]